MRQAVDKQPVKPVANPLLAAYLVLCASAFATLYDLLVYDVVPDVISITGAVTILTGAALLAWRETVRKGG